MQISYPNQPHLQGKKASHLHQLATLRNIAQTVDFIMLSNAGLNLTKLPPTPKNKNRV